MFSNLTIVGYQFLAEIKDMPAAYQHLRVRLRMEQTRLLNWGEKVGLLGELFDRPSQELGSNRNLIIDVLLEIQVLIKSCAKVSTKYDPVVASKASPSSTEASFDKRFSRGTNTLLRKVLTILEKTPELKGRMQWAMIKQDSFKSNVEKLISYNNSIEALLDRTSIDQLRVMQHQTNMAMLQLNSKVDELKEMSLAMQMKTPSHPGDRTDRLSRASTLVAAHEDENSSFACLADFKARQQLVESKDSGAGLNPIKRNDITIKSPNSTRSDATYQDKSVWIEWKASVIEENRPSSWYRMIDDRVRKLVTLLGSPNKPKQFRAPQCVGYIHQKNHEKKQYALVYEKPSNTLSKSTPVSLQELMRTSRMPSLTKRVAVANAIAQSLMYLHSVNWLHKGIRSNNIVFFMSPGKEPDYGEPILSGFEYARPDLTGETTEPTPSYSEHDIYRHPNTHGGRRPRSKKSDDVYSLGVVLIEIAYWRGIGEIVELPADEKPAEDMVKTVREALLGQRYMDVVEALGGETYKEVVRKCLTGGEELGLPESAEETDPEVGAAMLQVYSTDILGKLSTINA